MQSLGNITYVNGPAFAMPVAGDGDRVVPIETLNVRKIYSVLRQIALPLLLIPFISHCLSYNGSARCHVPQDDGCLRCWTWSLQESCACFSEWDLDKFIAGALSKSKRVLLKVFYELVLR